MSDHDAAPDPMDKAYAQAEAVLNDESARAARRERVLAAVASEAAGALAAIAPHKQRPSWARGGWLAAASVAGLSALVALQMGRLGVIEAPPAPTGPPVQAAAPAPTTAPPPAARAPAATPQAAPVVVAVTPRVAPASAPPPPVQAAREPETPPAPAAPAASDASSEEVVVTASRSAAAPSPAPSAQMEAVVRPASAVQGARLRAAAAAGRSAELTALLANGAPVDAQDDDGETALMKAVQGNHPAAAALLRRHGASLEAKNRAGDSARDLAAAIDDAELNRALDLGP